MRELLFILGFLIALAIELPFAYSAQFNTWAESPCKRFVLESVPDPTYPAGGNRFYGLDKMTPNTTYGTFYPSGNAFRDPPACFQEGYAYFWNGDSWVTNSSTNSSRRPCEPGPGFDIIVDSWSTAYPDILEELGVCDECEPRRNELIAQCGGESLVDWSTYDPNTCQGGECIDPCEPHKGKTVPDVAAPSGVVGGCLNGCRYLLKGVGLPGPGETPQYITWPSAENVGQSCKEGDNELWFDPGAWPPDYVPPADDPTPPVQPPPSDDPGDTPNPYNPDPDPDDPGGGIPGGTPSPDPGEPDPNDPVTPDPGDDPTPPPPEDPTDTTNYAYSPDAERVIDMNGFKQAAQTLGSKFPANVAVEMVTLIKTLKSDPVAPVFEIDFPLGADLEIDLSVLDPLATLWRWLLGFLTTFGTLLVIIRMWGR